MPDQAPIPEKPVLGNGRKRNWRPDGNVRQTAKGTSRGTQIVLLTVVLLILVGAVIGFLLWPSPFQAPYFLSLAITEYSAKQLPVSAFAEQDSDALLRHFPEGNRKEAFQSQQRDLLLRELAELKSRKDQAVVVYFRVQAVVRNHDVYLLPGDAKPDQSESWLPFGEFLDAVDLCPAPHKLLLLDVVTAGEDPSFGLLNGDLSEAIQDQLQARPTEGLLVLCACDRHQRSLISEELQRSVFAYYLNLGLSGWADGYGPSGKRDARITVRELADFVRDRVDRWAIRNRQTRQTLLLLGEGADFPLVVVENDRPPQEDLPTIDFDQNWLSPAWELRDQWWKDETFRLAPLAFRKLEAEVLRAEGQGRGGRDPDRVALTLVPEVRAARDQVRKARALASPSIVPKFYSLAQARPKVDAEMVATLRALLEQLDVAPPAEQAQVEKDFFKKIKDKITYPEFAAVVFELACDDGSLPTKARITRLAALLKGFSTQPQRLFTETILLEKLADFRVSAEKWPVEPVRQLLLTIRDEERVAAGDPRALQGLLRLQTEASKKRRAAESLFFKGNWDKATPMLTDARSQCQKSLSDLEVLKEAQRVFDESSVLLPATAFSYRDEKDGNAFSLYDSWSGAAKSMRSLLDLLNRTSDDTPPAIDEIRRVASELQDQLAALRRPYALKSWQSLVEKTDQAGPPQYLVIEGLLKSPCLASAERTQLLKVKNQIGERLVIDTLELDRSESARATDEVEKFAKKGDGETKGATPAVAQNAARRIGELFQLAGISGIDSLIQGLEVMSKPGSRIDGNRWQQLNDRVREVQFKELPLQLNKESRLEVQERLALALSPFQEIDFTNQPTAKRRLQEARVYWRWLSERYDAESNALAGEEVYQEFYRQAAQEYSRLAR
jgi:hypothetical protein